MIGIDVLGEMGLAPSFNPCINGANQPSAFLSRKDQKSG
jgi:hypothetical protein